MTRSVESRVVDMDWFVVCSVNVSHSRKTKMYRVSTGDRKNSKLSMATMTNDTEMSYRLSLKDFDEKALYPSVCITKYLLKKSQNRRNRSQ